MFVPIIVTEPAVGYGGGGALLFFHRPMRTPEEGEVPHKARPHPPSVSAIFGLATENGTWAAGARHFGIWRDDRIRTVTLGGYMSVNLTFYPEDVPVEFSLDGFIIDQEIEFRIGASDLFLGGRYHYSNTQATRQSGPSGLLPDESDNPIGGLGLMAHWDTRDNIFTPNAGQDLLLAGDFNNPGFGSDTTWWELDYQIHSYHHVHPRVVLGIRLDGQLTWGEVPFFALPYVDLRGIPALRYQGEKAGEGEVDIRWRVWKRWSLVGFVGLGWTADSDSTDNGPFPAGGGGLRYLISRKLGMQVGIDVARGPEDTAFYLQVGSAW